MKLYNHYVLNTEVSEVSGFSSRSSIVSVCLYGCSPTKSSSTHHEKRRLLVRLDCYI